MYMYNLQFKLKYLKYVERSMWGFRIGPRYSPQIPTRPGKSPGRRRPGRMRIDVTSSCCNSSDWISGQKFSFAMLRQPTILAVTVSPPLMVQKGSDFMRKTVKSIVLCFEFSASHCQSKSKTGPFSKWSLESRIPRSLSEFDGVDEPETY